MEQITLIVGGGENQGIVEQYQSLIGSVVGVIGAGLIALFTIWITNRIQNKTQIRESIRLLEISSSVALKNISDAIDNLNMFVDRINKIVTTPVERGEVTGYFISKTNFPDLYIDFAPSLMYSKFKSYYIHNKILIISTNLMNVNSLFKSLPHEYRDINDRAVTQISNRVSPENQRLDYVNSHKAFCDFIQKDLIPQLNLGLKEILQLKIQNRRHLLKKNYEIWKMERIDFKFFRNKAEIEKYTSELDMLDRIDELNKVDVEKFINKFNEEGRAS